MTKLTPQSPQRLIKVFERFGFTVSKRRPGDHMTMRKPGCRRPLVIPDYREVPVFIILNNLHTAGVSRDEYLKTLEDL